MGLIGILLFFLAPILVIGWCEYMANGITPPKKEEKKEKVYPSIDSEVELRLALEENYAKRQQFIEDNRRETEFYYMVRKEQLQDVRYALKHGRERWPGLIILPIGSGFVYHRESQRFKSYQDYIENYDRSYPGQREEHKKFIDRIIQHHAERKKSMGGKKDGEPNNPDQTPGTTTTGLQTSGPADGPAGGPDSPGDGVRL